MLLPSAGPRVCRHELRLCCDDGWRLSVQVLEPEAPRAVVLLGHAMMTDRRSLDRNGDGLASHLARRGLVVVLPDLRGHGQSGPRAAEGGRWSYDDLVHGDARLLARWVGDRYPTLRRVTVGHSLFGHVALAHACVYPAEAPHALVLLAANVWLPATEASLVHRIAKRTLLDTSLRLARGAGYFPARALRIGSADEALDYWEQLASFWSHNAWSTRDGRLYFALAGSLAQPVHIVAGAGDRLLCAPAAARAFAAHLATARFHVAGRATGLPLDPDHMQLVTDRRCLPLWDQLARLAVVTERQPRSPLSPSA